MAVRHSAARESGTATILLHGAAGSWTTWRAAIAAAETGGAVADLVVPDLPGWGDSPVDDLSRSGCRRLAAAVATVARALGYERWRWSGTPSAASSPWSWPASEPEATESVAARLGDDVRRPGDRLGRVPAVRCTTRCS